MLPGLTHRNLWRATLSLLRPLLPTFVLVDEMDPQAADPRALHPYELAVVAGAVERRRREFAAGRILARKLLSVLGFEGPLLRDADGPPTWPSGVRGSISHCATLAAVAMCRAEDCGGLGIDVEPRQALAPDVGGLVLAAEAERVLAAADPEAGLRVFCAKEAVYKAIYPITGESLDFDAVLIRPAPRSDGFLGEIRTATGPFRPGDLVPGRWRASRTHLAAAVVLRSPGDIVNLTAGNLAAGRLVG